MMVCVVLMRAPVLEIVISMKLQQLEHAVYCILMPLVVCALSLLISL